MSGCLHLRPTVLPYGLGRCESCGAIRGLDDRWREIVAGKRVAADRVSSDEALAVLKTQLGRTTGPSLGPAELDDVTMITTHLPLPEFCKHPRSMHTVLNGGLVKCRCGAVRNLAQEWHDED